MASLEDGRGNFTGPALCGTTGSFYDFGCNKRTGNFEIDILGVSAAAAVPEPSAGVLTALALIVGMKFRRVKGR